MKFLLIFRNRRLLIITLIGFLLRILNPSFGYPVLYVVADEVSNYMSAFNMISQKTFISLTSQYTPFGSYIQIPFFFLTFIFMLLTGRVHSLSEFEFFLTTHEGALLFIPRIISGIFGTLTIPIVYFTVKELFPRNKRIHWWSTLLFTFSLNHIQISHLGKPWAPALFFYMLSILYLIKSITRKRKASLYIIFSTLFIAISFGFLQIAFYALMLFTIMRLLYLGKKTLFSKENEWSLVGIIIVSITSFILVNLIKFRPTINFLFYFDPNKYSSYLDLFISIINNNNFIFFIQQLLTTESVLFLFAIPAFFMLKAWKKPLLGITIYTIIYFLITSLLFWKASRYLLPIIIILPFYAGMTISYLEKKIGSPLIKLTFTLILLSALSFIPLLWNVRFIQKPTFIQSKEWIDKEIDPKIPIASTSIRLTSFVPSLEAIMIIQQKNPDAYQRLKRYLKPDFYPENTRNILYLEKIVDGDIQKINQFIDLYKIQYIINYYWNPERSLLNKLHNKLVLVERFSPVNKEGSIEKISNLYSTMANPGAFTLLLNIERAGTYVEILQVKD